MLVCKRCETQYPVTFGKDTDGMQRHVLKHHGVLACFVCPSQDGLGVPLLHLEAKSPMEVLKHHIEVRHQKYVMLPDEEGKALVPE